jgi:hypothetical protein
MSRLLTSTDGSDEGRVRCFLHTSDFGPVGWYDPVEKAMKLSKPLLMEHSTTFRACQESPAFTVSASGPVRQNDPPEGGHPLNSAVEAGPLRGSYLRTLICRGGYQAPRRSFPSGLDR